MATATGPMTGVEFAAYRLRHMPPCVKVGDRIADVALSRFQLLGATAAHLRPPTAEVKKFKSVEQFSTAVKLGGGTWAVFFVPKAFTTVCSSDHLPGMVKAAEAFHAHGIQIACVAVNTRDEMFTWGQAHDPKQDIVMVPDFAGDFVFKMGLGMDKSVGDDPDNARHLGFVAQRAAILVSDGEVLDVQVEEDAGKCSIKSSAEGLLARLSDSLEQIKRKKMRLEEEPSKS